MPKVIKSQLIELPLIGVAVTGNTSVKVQFPDQPYLRNKSVLGIEFLNVNDMTLSETGKTLLTVAQMKTAYLTLYLNDPGEPKNVGEWIQNIPLTLLHRVQNTTNDPFVRQMFEMVGQRVYWEKCYITLAAPFANTTDLSFLFYVYFKG